MFTVPVVTLPKLRTVLPYVVMGLVLFGFSEMSFADTLGGAATKLKTDIAQFGPLIKTVVILAGIAFVAMGINGFIQAQKREESISGPLTLIVVGVLMVSFITVIGLGGSSFGFSSNSDVSSLVN